MKTAKKEDARDGAERGSDTQENAGNAVLSDDYNAVVANAQLVDVLLIGATFKMVPKYYDASAKEFQFNLVKATVVSNEEAGNAHGVFQWAVKATSGDETVLELSANFMAVYTSLEGQNAKAVDAFVRRLGPFTTYPYFRSYVSNLSWMSKANLPILPVLTESDLEPTAADSES